MYRSVTSIEGSGVAHHCHSAVLLRQRLHLCLGPYKHKNNTNHMLACDIESHGGTKSAHDSLGWVGGVTTKPTAAEHRYSVAGKEETETRKERSRAERGSSLSKP